MSNTHASCFKSTLIENYHFSIALMLSNFFKTLSGFSKYIKTASSVAFSTYKKELHFIIEKLFFQFQFKCRSQTVLTRTESNESI